MGHENVYPEQISGAPYLEIEPRDMEIARYGINTRDLNDVIETAIGGNNLTTTIEGRQRFPVRVRYMRELRDTPEAIGRVLVSGMNGVQVPLSQVADIRIVNGPSMISSENGLLRGLVLLNATRLQLLGGRLGRIHRAVRRRGADRDRNGRLSRRGCRQKEGRTRQTRQEVAA